MTKSELIQNAILLLKASIDCIEVQDKESERAAQKRMKRLLSYQKRQRPLRVNYEHTDTFAGEANYSWVNRGTIYLPSNSSDRSIVLAVKKELGMAGVPCYRDDYSGTIELRPRHACQVIFITFGA